MIEGLDTWGPEFDLRYVVLDSALITNRIEPSKEHIDILNADNGFYIKLEESILKEGFRNPIIVIAGWSDDGIDMINGIESEDNPNELGCFINGGSRLWVAQKNRLKIPCLVADYIGQFKDEILVSSVDEAITYYQDEVNFIFCSNCINVNYL